MTIQAMAQRVVNAQKALTYFFAALVATLAMSSQAQAVNLGDDAPQFTLQTLEGKNFDLSQYRGEKPVYLVFWATWCPICRAEIPHIKKLYQELGDKVEFLAVNVGFQDSLEKAKIYREEHALPYPVAFDEGTVITRDYKVVGTPWQVVIDINGKVRYFSNETPVTMAEHLEGLYQKEG
ncbi:MAG: peroxiredoxin family protein [Pseudomonadales bacterium]